MENVSWAFPLPHHAPHAHSSVQADANKMPLANLGLVLQPALDLSQPLLAALLRHAPALLRHEPVHRSVTFARDYTCLVCVVDLLHFECKILKS